MAGELTALWWALAGVVARSWLLMVAWLVCKGRPFAPGDVFRASRLSAGNRLFPTQVAITPTSVVQYTPQWIGKLEEDDPHGARLVGQDRHRACCSPTC